MSSEGFTLLPARPGVCPQCAVDHEPGQPHSRDSLFYQYRFYSQRGRWPTWKDAVAHCSDDIREKWERVLKARGAWTEPESEVPDVLPTPHRTIGTVTSWPIERKKGGDGTKQ